MATAKVIVYNKYRGRPDPGYKHVIKDHVRVSNIGYEEKFLDEEGIRDDLESRSGRGSYLMPVCALVVKGTEGCITYFYTVRDVHYLYDILRVLKLAI